MCSFHITSQAPSMPPPCLQPGPAGPIMWLLWVRPPARCPTVTTLPLPFTPPGAVVSFVRTNLFLIPLYYLSSPSCPILFFLSVSSFLIYYFSLLFWLLLIHLLRTGKYWATHLNNTYMKWDVLVPEWPVKAVVCHISYHGRTNLVGWKVSIQLLLL